MKEMPFPSSFFVFRHELGVAFQIVDERRASLVAFFIRWRPQNRRGMIRRQDRSPLGLDHFAARRADAKGSAEKRLRRSGSQAHDQFRSDQFDLAEQPWAARF